MKRTSLLLIIIFCLSKCAFSQSILDSSYLSDCDKIYENSINRKLAGWDCVGIERNAQIQGFILAVDCYRDNDNIDKGLEILLSKVYSSNELFLEIGYRKEWIVKLAELYTIKYGKKGVRKQLRKVKFNHYIDDIYSIIDSKQIIEYDSTILNLAAVPVNFTVEIFGRNFCSLHNLDELKSEERVITLKILKSHASPKEIEDYCMKVWLRSTLYQELNNDSKF